MSAADASSEPKNEEMAESSNGQRTVAEELLFRARWGCVQGSGELGQFMLVIKKCGDLVNTRDKYQRTPLIVASKRNQMDMVEIFIGHNADVNLVDERGNTAIMHAAQQGHKDVVEKLIEAKADLLHENQFGFTAELMATKAGHKEVAKRCEEVADKQADEADE